MITLITPTGAREEQIKICAKLMHKQDYKGQVTWVIVDDAIPRTTDFIKEDFKENWTIKKIHPLPEWQEGQNTQGRNFCTAFEYVKTIKTDAIFIIEDDDYYTPSYLTKMIPKLGGYDLTGERNSIYYNVLLRCWCRNGNDWWSSLFQTAFKPSVIPVFEQLYKEKFIDLSLFKYVKNKYLFNDGDYAIGIKGMLGRKGIGAGHGWIRNMKPDDYMIDLKKFTGDDYILYESFYMYK